MSTNDAVGRRVSTDPAGNPASRALRSRLLGRRARAGVRWQRHRPRRGRHLRCGGHLRRRSRPGRGGRRGARRRPWCGHGVCLAVRAAYLVLGLGPDRTVQAIRDDDGTGTLAGVERIQFADGWLDTTTGAFARGHAGSKVQPFLTGTDPWTRPSAEELVSPSAVVGTARPPRRPHARRIPPRGGTPPRRNTPGSERACARRRGPDRRIEPPRAARATDLGTRTTRTRARAGRSPGWWAREGSNL